jgi:hypothetical protein
MYGPAPEGRNVLVLNGTDRHGLAASPGIYFCRIEAGGEVETRKLALAR